MKKIILSIALISAPVIISANQYYPSNSNGFNTPNFNWGNGNKGSNWNMPNMNWGNGNNRFNNGSNWNVPNMNWGNNNGGSNWNMPNMNWGNNNGGSNWNMPNMNWGNNNGGSNWNMPNMNGSNKSGYGNGSNWNMPNMNWGNNGNNSFQPWNFGNNGFSNRYYGAKPNYRFAPKPAYKAPTALLKPKAVMSKANVVAPKTMNQSAALKVNPAIEAAKKVVTTTANKIPTPNEVKGVVLAPENKPKVTIETSTPVK